MAKNKMERIEKIRNEMEQLKKQEKELLKKHKEEERKARNRRLCSRHGLLEKYMPDLINITDEQFEIFVKTGIDTSYGKKRLGEIMAQGGATATQNPTDVAETAEDGVSANPQNHARSGA